MTNAHTQSSVMGLNFPGTLGGALTFWPHLSHTVYHSVSVYQSLGKLILKEWTAHSLTHWELFPANVISWSFFFQIWLLIETWPSLFPLLLHFFFFFSDHLTSLSKPTHLILEIPQEHQPHVYGFAPTSAGPLFPRTVAGPSSPGKLSPTTDNLLITSLL